MRTEDALILMDQEVQYIDAIESSLNIDYDPNANGFSLFYVTFEGNLVMKNKSNDYGT